MNPDIQNETTLAQVRLHRAIFIFPFLMALPLALLALPVLFLFYTFNHLMGQVGPQHVTPINGIFSLFFFLPAFAMGSISLLMTWVAYSKSIISLTNKRLIYRTGWMTRVAGELPLNNVEAIFMIEPLLGRVFGYGTVMVTSVGGLRFPFRFIGEPQNFHAILQTAINDAKRRVPAMDKVPSPSLPIEDDSRYMPQG